MKPSTLKCLHLLRAHDFVTTHDFLIAGCGSRFGARLAELRHEHGYVIDEKPLKGDVSGSRYVLVAEPELRDLMPESPRLSPVRRIGGAAGVDIPRQTYLWVATSDRGEWCGHWHTHANRASQCARSHERYFRMRYGERQNWAISQVTVPLANHVSLAERVAA